MTLALSLSPPRSRPLAVATFMPRQRLRAPVRGILLFALLAGALLAGCFGEAKSPVEVEPYLAKLTGTQARTLQIALFVRSTDSFKQTLPVTVEGLPERWTSAGPEITLPGRAAMPLLVNVTPSSEATFGEQAFRVKVGETAATVTVDVVEPGAMRVAPGALVELEFVTWARNGSVVAANAPHLLNGTGIPNATYDPAAFGLPNATLPLRGYVPSDAQTDERLQTAGYAPLPPAWTSVLLLGPDGGGALAGDTVATSWQASNAVGELGALLRVIAVSPPPS